MLGVLRASVDVRLEDTLLATGSSFPVLCQGPFATVTGISCVNGYLHDARTIFTGHVRHEDLPQIILSTVAGLVGTLGLWRNIRASFFG